MIGRQTKAFQAAGILDIDNLTVYQTCKDSYSNPVYVTVDLDSYIKRVTGLAILK